MLSTLSPITIVLLWIGAAAALSEQEFLWGLLPFLVALLNEVVLLWIRAASSREDE